MCRLRPLPSASRAQCKNVSTGQKFLAVSAAIGQETASATSRSTASTALRSSAVSAACGGTGSPTS
jgi:hypothetical protein